MKHTKLFESVPHTAKSPFPIKHATLGSILDEACSCGHKRSEHGDTFSFGHGSCWDNDCHCHQFTWAAFILSNGPVFKV